MVIVIDMVIFSLPETKRKNAENSKEANFEPFLKERTSSNDTDFEGQTRW